MGIKFYKEGTQYVLGDSALDYVPAGLYWADVHLLNGLDYLKIAPVGKQDAQWDSPFSGYDDSTGTPYTSIGALMTAIKGFFAEGIQSVSFADTDGNTLLPSGTPAKLTYELTRPADLPGAYTIGDAINTSTTVPTIITLADAAITNTGGGFALLLKAESNMTTLAGGTLRIWFYNAAPTSLVADHVAFISSYSNANKRIFYVDVTFDALLAGSDTVIGLVELSKEYLTVDKNMYALVQTLTSFVPTSAGKISLSLSILKLA